MDRQRLVAVAERITVPLGEEAIGRSSAIGMSPVIVSPSPRRRGADRHEQGTRPTTAPARGREPRSRDRRPREGLRSPALMRRTLEIDPAREAAWLTRSQAAFAPNYFELVAEALATEPVESVPAPVDPKGT